MSIELNKIYCGDSLELLKQMDSESVQCVITSPPYWGLRDYGVDGQYGLEQTPEQYVDNLVRVFREARRVLKKDGTLWLNLGDSYAGSNGNGYKQTLANENYSTSGGVVNQDFRKVFGKDDSSFKPKDLCMIPHRTAIALQQDGWWVRNDIVWDKNCMPESVTDRCTKSHEYIFLLTKSANYYYDAEAIKEPSVYPERWGNHTKIYHESQKESLDSCVLENRNKRTVWKINTQPYKEAHFATFPLDLPKTCILAGTKKGDVVLDIFSGAGTTLVAAEILSRQWIGLELNPKYVAIAEKRIDNYLRQGKLELE